MPLNIDLNGGNGFASKDIIAVSQFDLQHLEQLAELAERMKILVEQFGHSDLLGGKVLANLFYEPSTRTSSSFQTAMLRLGGQVVAINNVAYSSVVKGENLPDTVRTLESYADAIVLRHPETGSARLAASVLTIPLINAGDGTGEHPTQALLDWFTIKQRMGGLDGLKVAMVGDLLYGRTVHSLMQLLCHYDVEFVLASPDVLAMPEHVLNAVRKAGRPFEVRHTMEDVLADADVLYMTRVQKERFDDPTVYARLKDDFVLTAAMMELARQNMIVMHPLPRVNELDSAIDEDPRAAYFDQMRNGMYVRMALLAAVFGRSEF